MIFLKLGRRLGLNVEGKVGSMSRGLVQQYDHTILPSITPTHTFIITFLVMMVTVSFSPNRISNIM